jgi:hypothetical protein
MLPHTMELVSPLNALNTSTTASRDPEPAWNQIKSRIQREKEVEND